ncbi:MAG: hypothetical protein U0V49_13120 [Saprospiraceae bacterium]
MDAFLSLAIDLFAKFYSEASIRGRKFLFVKIPVNFPSAPASTFLTVMQIILMPHYLLRILIWSLLDIGGVVIPYKRKSHLVT